jgi:hypothetical protein
MPKKSKKPMLQFDISCSCTISVRPEHNNSFERDLKRGEICLLAEVNYDGGMTGFNIYPDRVKGDFLLTKIDDINYRLEVRGAYSTEDSFGLLASIKDDTAAPNLMLKGISDRDLNDHYIDGNQSAEISIGKLVR